MKKTADPASILIERKETPSGMTFPEDLLPLPPRRSRTATALERNDLRYKLGPDGKPRSVTEVRSKMVRGVTPTGKTFARWHTESIKSVIVTSSGKQLLFSRTRLRGSHHVHCLPHYEKEGWHHGGGPLFAKAAELLGTPPSFDELYPLASGIGLHPIFSGNADFLRNWLHASDAQTLTRNLFGKTRYRKDLVKAVAEADPFGIWLAWSMRGLVPVDWLVDLLRRSLRTGGGRELQPPGSPVRPHLRALDRNSLRRLTQDIGTRAVHRYADDLARMNVAQPVRVRSWQELHDHTARHDLQARRARDYTIEPPRLSEEDKKRIEQERKDLSGRTAGGLLVKAADDAGTLVDWGTEMSNCIASYTHPMLTGHTHLLGIYDGEKLIANAEVTGGTLRQLLGPANRTLPADQRGDVLNFLTARSVAVGNYWGDH